VIPNREIMPEWRSVALSEQIRHTQTMLLQTEQQMLYVLARDYFKNFGVIVDGGCFLGGSTLALAEGLRANKAYAKAPSGAVIHSYDLFVVEPWTIGVYFPDTTPLGTSFETKFRQNIARVADLVSVHAGDVTMAPVPDRPIEILFIDLAKHWTVSDYVVRTFFPKLVAGHSLVIQQDYLYHTWTGWLPVTMEFFSEYFEIVDHTEDNSVVFFYKKQIPEHMLERDVIQSMTRTEIRNLSNLAIARFSGHQREVLLKSRDQFQELLADANWPM